MDTSCNNSSVWYPSPRVPDDPKWKKDGACLKICTSDESHKELRMIMDSPECFTPTCFGLTKLFDHEKCAEILKGDCCAHLNVGALPISPLQATIY